MLFPVPWRVEIVVQDPTLGPPGVPGVALANQSGGPSASNRLVAEMMPRGAYLIDERSGQVYRVARRDYDLAGARGEAVLTFEQEIPEIARLLIDAEPSTTSDRPFELALAQALLHAPQVSIQGGTREILRVVIARGMGLQ